MLVCKCDHCGKEMGGNVLAVPATIAGVQFDFCDKCHKEVISFIKKDAYHEPIAFVPVEDPLMWK